MKILKLFIIGVYLLFLSLLVTRNNDEPRLNSETEAKAKNQNSYQQNLKVSDYKQLPMIQEPQKQEKEVKQQINHGFVKRKSKSGALPEVLKINSSLTKSEFTMEVPLREAFQFPQFTKKLDTFDFASIINDGYSDSVKVANNEMRTDLTKQ